MPPIDNRRETQVFANERRCNDWDEVIEEGRAMNATGTGITVGTQCLIWKSRSKPEQLKCIWPTASYHLYTNPIRSAHSKRFADAGLAVSVSHPQEKLSRYIEVIDECSGLGIDVGIESPLSRTNPGFIRSSR